jgi:hypothetical protein
MWPHGRIVCQTRSGSETWMIRADRSYGGDGGYWWHCFDCRRNYDRAEDPFR